MILIEADGFDLKKSGKGFILEIFWGPHGSELLGEVLRPLTEKSLLFVMLINCPKVIG